MLAEKLKAMERSRRYTFPTTVRLWAETDAYLQQVVAAYSHLTQTQIINMLLMDAMERLNMVRE